MVAVNRKKKWESVQVRTESTAQARGWVKALGSRHVWWGKHPPVTPGSMLSYAEVGATKRSFWGLLVYFKIIPPKKMWGTHQQFRINLCGSSVVWGSIFKIFPFTGGHVPKDWQNYNNWHQVMDGKLQSFRKVQNYCLIQDLPFVGVPMKP